MRSLAQSLSFGIYLSQFLLFFNLFGEVFRNYSVPVCTALYNYGKCSNALREIAVELCNEPPHGAQWFFLCYIPAFFTFVSYRNIENSSRTILAKLCRTKNNEHRPKYYISYIEKNLI